jgi:hypothetical protein
MRRHLTLLAGLFAILFTVSAYADCIEGMRSVTPGEAQYFKTVSAALKQALPAPPQNWTLAPQREQDLGGLCNGDREGAFKIQVTANYTYTPPKAEGDRLYAEYRKLQADIDALKQLPAAVAKERQGWLDKMSEANRASNAAGKAGDKVLAKQKDTEAEDYSKKARDIRDQYLASVRPNVEQLEARQKALEYRGSAVTVRIVANEEGSARASSAPIVIGKAPTPQSPGLKVHNVRVYVEGSAEKRAVIQAAIDKAALARIAQ